MLTIKLSANFDAGSVKGILERQCNRKKGFVINLKQ